MLGRQQIAGIPTAVSEVFKNSFDAYADIAVADFIRRNRLLVLRDDGIGMTPKEFDERWLILGTESKLLAADTLDLKRAAVDPDKPLRPVLGEKGIGRLAIAAIGPQVLVMTRAKRPARSPLVVALVNWSLFECPGVNLDEVDIPVREFPHGTFPSSDDIGAMVGTLRANVHRVRHQIGAAASRILSELDLFTIDPIQLDRVLGEPSLHGDGHGLHFIIRPVDPSLADGIDKPEGGRATPSLTRVLIGFSNTMTPGHAEPPLKTVFNDRTSTPQVPNDLIAEGKFWTPDDFDLADHTFRGEFDAFGQFTGQVSIYGHSPEQWDCPWNGAPGKKTECGPFRITAAHVQGRQRESRLGPEDWSELNGKLADLGGLYIYRDGVRILPYGTADYDFIGIELKRSKGAGFHFFSYRRLFGSIEIRSADNPQLQEKAGREGFRENLAYRQFTDILGSFFDGLARQYFQLEGPLSQAFVAERAELSRIRTELDRRESSVSRRRLQFERDMDGLFDRVAAAEPAAICRDLLAEFLSTIASAKTFDDPEAAAAAIVSGEAVARAKLQKAREQFHTVRPRGVSLPRRLVKDWTALVEVEERLDREEFTPTAALIETAAAEAAAGIHLAVARRQRFDRIIQDAADATTRDTRREGDLLRTTATSTRDDVTARSREVVAKVAHTVSQVLADAQRTDVLALKEEAVTRHRQQLEQRLQIAADEAIVVVSDLRLRLEDTRRAARGEAVADEEMMATVEDEILELRQRSEEDMDLVQLGMAMDIVNHEFGASIRVIRTNLRSLKPWSDANPKLKTLHDGIRAGFDHLDGYLKLFTPLQRRLYREPVPITGHTIADFLSNLFSRRLERHGVTLNSTPAFQATVIMGYPSTFLPVFVNLLDNAIFWIGDQRRRERVVTLDAHDGVLFIADSGSGVSDRDRVQIFEPGFSRKPAGRGLGLYIVRDVLDRAGWDIRLDSGIPGDTVFALQQRAESV
jgi:signal transduction histidine kinase